MIIKMISGWVRQELNNEGQCVRQDFVSQGAVAYEDENGPLDARKVVELQDNHHPMDMVQPNSKENELRKEVFELKNKLYMNDIPDSD